MMLVVGLTGSIGMGKSTAAQRFKELGISVFDADAEVHALYAGQLIAPIEAVFPGTTSDGGVDRKKLSAILLSAPHRFKELERIVHPKVREQQLAFLKREYVRGSKMAVLEIPLLFESGGDAFTDVTVVVSANEDLQQQRVLAREGMTEEKLNEFLRRQLPDAEKRARADFVVDTSGSVGVCNQQVDAIVRKLGTYPANAYERHWVARV